MVIFKVLRHSHFQMGLSLSSTYPLDLRGSERKSNQQNITNAYQTVNQFSVQNVQMFKI